MVRARPAGDRGAGALVGPTVQPRPAAAGRRRRRPARAARSGRSRGSSALSRSTSAWCTTSSVPPGCDEAAAGRQGRGRGTAPGRTPMTRSKPPSGRSTAAAAAGVPQVTSAPAASAAAPSPLEGDAGRVERPSPVQPWPASHTASAPSPQPTSSARAGAVPSTSTMSARFGSPLQTPGRSRRNGRPRRSRRRAGCGRAPGDEAVIPGSASAGRGRVRGRVGCASGVGVMGRVCHPARGGAGTRVRERGPPPCRVSGARQGEAVGAWARAAERPQ